MSEQKSTLPPEPQALEGQLSAWCQDDRCFQTLYLLWCACVGVGLDHGRHAFEHFNLHYSNCGRCWQNVLIAADNSTNPVKRKIYYNLYHLSLFELMKRDGGDCQVDQTPEGMSIRVKYPPALGEPWVGGEVFIPTDRGQEAWIALDVRDVAGFESPKAILQRLDEISSSEVKNFDNPGGEAIQWWTIVQDRPATLKVRWHGRVKDVVKDWTLQSRYRPLLRAEAVRKRMLQQESGFSGARFEPSAGEEAMQLKRLALEYDGRSKFPGFAKTRLRHRRVDAHRHAKIDAARRSDSLDIGWGAARDDGAKADQEKMDNLLRPVVERESTALHEQSMEKIDSLQIRVRLESMLSPRDKEILRLKLDEGLSDSETGSRLNLARETVNRTMRRIKMVRAKLKS